MLWWLLGGLIAYIIYITIIKPMSYWKERNVAHMKSWPLLGNMAPLIFRRRSFMQLFQDFYNEFPNKRYNGILSFTKPQIIIRDLDLIKQIAIKDFDHFMDRTASTDEHYDQHFSKVLPALSGEKWRSMRSTLSPTFTSSKMRFLFTLISDCAERFIKYFEKHEEAAAEVNMKDAYTRFTNDAIASTAFGIRVDSLKNQENTFFLMGKQVNNTSGLQGLKMFLVSSAPKVLKFFRVSIFSEEFVNFFRNIIKETINIRETQRTVRPDMIHLLLEARKGKLSNEDQPNLKETCFSAFGDDQINNAKKIQLTNDDITAQAMMFFFAGFETTSTLLCFMSHEVAVNPDIQKRLQMEIDETLATCDGKITYEALMGMKYLDMVVSETLRKWSPGIALERKCVKDYVIMPKLSDERPIIIEKGVTVLIPMLGIHYDPKYFPNPNKFDPERFNDENKSKIVTFSYMPFGIGPRNCIASRFAIMESKILFFHLLSKFDIVSTEKTVIPLVLSKSFTMAPDNGFWLGYRKRKNHFTGK